MDGDLPGDPVLRGIDFGLGPLPEAGEEILRAEDFLTIDKWIFKFLITYLIIILVSGQIFSTFAQYTDIIK